jgi:predicted PurR-regulated permease PerM
MFRKSAPADPAEIVPAGARAGALWTDTMGRIGTRSAQTLLLLLVVSIVVYVAVVLKLVAIPVILALIIASAFRPLVRILSTRMPRTLAAVLSLFAGVIVFGVVIYIVVSSVISQFDSLQKSVSEGVDAVADFVNNGPFQIDSTTLGDLQDSVVGFITSSQFGAGAIAGVSTAAEIVTGAVLAVILLFYFLKDGPEIWAFLIRPFKPSNRQRAERAGDAAITTLGGYIRGTAIVAAVDAICIGVALVILQVPLAIPLAIVVFLGAFIPLVGATASGVIAALVTLVTVDFGSAIVVGIVVLAVQLLEGNFLSPVVLGRSLKLHGVVVLLALTAGTVLGGIVGTLLAVPACAVAWAVIKAWPTPEPQRAAA